MTTSADAPDPREGDAGSARPDPLPIDRRAFLYYGRLGRLDRFVSEHYDQPISLATAASLVGLEETYFSSFFHAKTGVCFHDWLAHVRVGKAKSILRRANLPITRVARLVGFNHLSTFERTFKKHTGLTPRAYKKAVRPGT